MNKLAKSDLKNIEQMARESASRSEIALVYGVTAPAIGYVLKQLGISAVHGTRGRRSKGYSLAQSSSPTLRRIAAEKGLITSAKAEKKPTHATIAAGKPAAKPSATPKKTAQAALRDTGDTAKPWEYHGIYDPEKGRIISPSELKQSISKNIGAGRQPGSPGKTAGTGGRKKVAAKKKSKPAIGEVPETAPGSGTEEQQGGTTGAETTNLIAAAGETGAEFVDSETVPDAGENAAHEEPASLPDETVASGPAIEVSAQETSRAPEPTAAEVFAAFGKSNPDGDLVVPEFLRPSHPAEGSRPRISNSTIMVGGAGRSAPRQVQVSRISRPGSKKPAITGVVARHFSNVALVVQSGLIETAEKLEQETRDLLAATKGSVSPKHLYRNEIASRVKTVMEMVDQIEISLLQL